MRKYGKIMRFHLPSPAAGKVERLTQVGYQVVGVQSYIIFSAFCTALKKAVQGIFLRMLEC